MFNLLLSIVVCFSTSFYSLSFTTSEGETVSMQSFQGKKVLVVNIASESRFVQQLTALEQLQQQYKEQLVIIAFPSNSFSKEPLTDAAIQGQLKNQHNTTFLLAQKGSVKGSAMHPVYHWLTHQSENGVMQGEVSGDFHKYLIDETGELIGAWAPSISPTDDSIKEAIAN